MTRCATPLLLVAVLLGGLGCDSTVENATSVEGEWTGSGQFATATDTPEESFSIEVTFEEAEDGELSGTGIFTIDGREPVDLRATGLRSSNQVDAAFLREAEPDTIQYDGAVQDEGRRIEGVLDWNRREGTARVMLEKQ